MAKNRARGLIGRKFSSGVRKRRARCVGAVVTALLTAAMLVPTQAFAASLVYIEGADHAAGSTYSGTGWAWDGADALDLNDYNGGIIKAEGDLIITSTGTNTVTATDGDTAIDVSGEPDHFRYRHTERELDGDGRC